MISLIKNNKLLSVISLSLFLFSGCSPREQKSDNLTVTIEPLRYFLEQIVGDKFSVTSLVSSGSNPESFDPAPSQMIELSKSKAYFKVGYFGIENTLIEKVKDEANLNIIDCSKGIDIIQEECHHDHDEDHAHHAHAGGDPHYWSSITSAKYILKNMLDAVIQLDKENKDFYTANYSKELDKINRTDSIIKGYLSASESKSFVIYHPALSYFAKEYDLEQLSIEHEGKSPSPNQLKSLIDEAAKENVKAVFIQQEFDVKNAEVIAKQIEAKTYPINLLSYDWHEEMIKIAKAIANKE